MATTKIFLASSSELMDDRNAFREFASVENDLREAKGVYIKVSEWKYFLDAISETRLQDEYNNEILNCDILVCLFFTKAGKYTREEFETALKNFRDTGKPLIYTYFKTGAPIPEPDDENAQSLASFKKRLEDIGHFYTTYDSISDLKYKFGLQLRKLEDMGFEGLQSETKVNTAEAIKQYFETNVVIQNVTDSSITINVGGNQQTIEKKLEVLLALVEKMQASSIRSAGKTFTLDSVNEANFNYVLGQATHEKGVPRNLVEDLITGDTVWVDSLKLGLQKIAAVGNKPSSIFQHFGCLIEENLRKMITSVGKERNLRRLSFMAEVFQSSVRYLCFIQIAQILKSPDIPNHPLFGKFLFLDAHKNRSFDYMNLLIVSSHILRDSGPFMPEINQLADELADPGNDLFKTALFLEENRNHLLNNKLVEDAQFDNLLDQYLTGLVTWLRQCAFLAKYRLVSIKDINLVYRLGTAKRFVHHYGELHGIYVMEDSFDYPNYSIKESFTYNQSVLLFSGNSVTDCLDSLKDDSGFISLSPLIIDLSVYAEKEAQTPEIYYYAGYSDNPRQYHFAHCRNELAFGEQDEIRSNKFVKIRETNISQPKLDELFQQIENIFEPLRLEGS